MTVLDDIGGVWTLDPARTRIGFSASVTTGATVRCQFTDVAGQITVCPARPSGSSVLLQLATASLDTGDPVRNAELCSAEYFDAARHPEIIFRSTVVDNVRDAQWLVVGDLTIRGITRQFSIMAHFTGIERGPAGEERTGFVGEGRIDRRDWGLHWEDPLTSGGAFVMEKTLIEIDVSAVKTAGVDGLSPLPPLPGKAAGADEPGVGQQRRRVRAGLLGFLRRRSAEEPARRR